MKKSIFIFSAFAAITFASCGGNETKIENAPVTNTEVAVEETAIAAASPVTKTSGNSFELVKESAVKKYTIKYTVIDFTTNEPVAKLPINEFAEPGKGKQMLKVRMEATILALSGVTQKEPLKAFSIIVSEGAKEIQAFTQFSEEFNKANAPKYLEVNGKQELTFYFVIPADADLSNAMLSLYHGSEGPDLTVKLNP